MSLAGQIIEQGPFVAGDAQPDWMRWPQAADYNALRDELIELQRLRLAATQAAHDQCGCLGGILNEWSDG